MEKLHTIFEKLYGNNGMISAKNGFKNSN